MWGLIRGAQWICAPKGDGRPLPQLLTTEASIDNAWLADTLDDAIERQQLLRMVFGLSTEIRAVR